MQSVRVITNCVLSTQVFISVQNPVFIGEKPDEKLVEDKSLEISSLEFQVDALTGVISVILVIFAVFFAIFLGKKYKIFAKIAVNTEAIRNALKCKKTDLPETIVERPIIQEANFNDAEIVNAADEVDGEGTGQEGQPIGQTEVDADITVAIEEEGKPLAIECATVEPDLKNSDIKNDGKKHLNCF